jgi:ethanolamine ammonia-lyase large subunit
VRQALDLRPAPEFEDWLLRMGVTNRRHRLKKLTLRNRLLAARGGA